MTSAINRITQANVARAIRAVKAEGLKVVSTEIAPDGTIRLVHSDGEIVQDEWDKWKSKKHEGSDQGG